MTEYRSNALTGAGRNARQAQDRARARLPRSIAFTLLATALAAATPGNAVQVFSDDFNTETDGKTQTFTRSLEKWTMEGVVDIIAPDNSLGYKVGSPLLDLGGGLSGGRIRTKNSISYKAGDIVTISADLGGNQMRPDSFDLFTFDFRFEVFGEEEAVPVDYVHGTGRWWFVDFPYELKLYKDYYADDYTFKGSDPLTFSSITFKAQQAGSFQFLLGTRGGGFGPLIDNVSVDIVSGVVPEPATWGMMLVGFGLVGAAIRRRQPVRIA
jgi:hypothetical protein